MAKKDTTASTAAETAAALAQDPAALTAYVEKCEADAAELVEAQAKVEKLEATVEELMAQVSESGKNAPRNAFKIGGATYVLKTPRFFSAGQLITAEVLKANKSLLEALVKAGSQHLVKEGEDK